MFSTKNKVKFRVSSCGPLLLSLLLKMESKFKNIRIGELVEKDSVYAHVLFYFDIKFYEYAEQTLEEVCLKKGLRLEQVTKELESPGKNFQEEDLPLVTYPIDLIIEYLKHAHFLFIKHKLPYIGRLVNAFKANHPDYVLVERDLKTVFPLFLEDFIHHIYEEEDSLFKHIKLLQRAAAGSFNPAQLYHKLEKQSLQKFALDHEAHDDEMAGIRRITKDYFLSANAPVHVKVIYAELIALEKSLQTHARIENEILFPKAMALEQQVRNLFFEKSKWN